MLRSALLAALPACPAVDVATTAASWTLSSLYDAGLVVPRVLQQDGAVLIHECC